MKAPLVFMFDARIINKTINRIKKVRKHPALRRFISHNKRVFPLADEAGHRRPVVLFELNGMQSAHIAYSYLANVLAENEQARIVAYQPTSEDQVWRRLYFFARQAIGFDRFGTYASFGTTEFLRIDPTASQKQRARALFDRIAPALCEKVDVERLAVDGVSIGDLVYDSYLKRFRKPTIEIEAPEFQAFLLESLEIVLFWQDYLDGHDVRAINVSHCVYNIAIPLRLAVKRGIPVFQATATHVYRLDQKNQFAYNDFHYFRERFAALPEDVRTAGLARAEQQIARRFSGEVGVDMGYSTKSAYGQVREERVLADSDRKKILIATHCFFDSPHSYGNNVFPDFYEWLDFLGQMTRATDYDWYIKTHPDYLPGTMEIIQEFIRRYPKFTLIPPDTSHHQIIAEGIDLALSVYGTLGFEYAALGIPVINASQNNPHIAYEFNLHARDADDYRRLLSDPELWSIRIDKQQIYEYYFMRFIYNSEDIFFDSYKTVVDELGGYKAQFKPAVYDKWLAEFTPEKHDRIKAALRRFIEAEDFRMDYTHFGRDFSVQLIGAPE